ncbi:MAG: hypothetical protein PHD55_04425 [Methanoregula sp.]|nr:hypothetical protein [Methanoregula sp.]
MKYSLFCVFLILLGLLAVPALASAPAGGSGWLTINCNVDGASVYLDGTYKGTISGGSLDIGNGVDASTYKVTKDGYYDATGSVNYVPGGDANMEITVTLEAKPTGSGKGWITVYSDVNGASVSFNGVTKGTISGGSFTLEVSTTGTPYTTYSVSKSGYYTYTGSVTMPSNDQTVTLYPELVPIPVTAPTTAVTTTLIGGDTGYYQFHCNVNGASVSLDGTNKGIISNGVLTVTVYTTGTPYKTYSVSANGYTSVSGTLPTTPARGQTQDVYVTLSASSSPVTETATVPPAGSGQGTYAVYCNVDGANVYFDDTFQGTISNGALYDSVPVTGTPFTTYRVEKDGYVTASGSIVQHPSAGEIVSLHVNLVKSTTTAATAAPTTKPSPLPATVVLFGLIGAGMIVALASRRDRR